MTELLPLQFRKAKSIISPSIRWHVRDGHTVAFKDDPAKSEKGWGRTVATVNPPHEARECDQAVIRVARPKGTATTGQKLLILWQALSADSKERRNPGVGTPRFPVLNQLHVQLATEGRMKATESARTRQDNSQLRPEARTPRPPRISPGGIYSAQDLMHNLQIGPAKLQEWSRAKSPLKPLGTATKSHLYFADDVIAFMRRLGAT